MTWWSFYSKKYSLLISKQQGTIIPAGLFFRVMNRHDFFLRLSAWSLVLTAFTTLVAHLVVFSTSSFEDSVLLFQNQGYILRNDVIILHCVLVIISMLGLGLLEIKNNPGWAGLGFLCFVVFGLAEITRMTMANVMVNGLREEYFQLEDPVRRESIRHFLEVQWPLMGEILFLIFIVAFSFGCLFYGIVFLNRWWIGKIFLLWGMINLFAFVNVFLQSEWVGSGIEYFSIFFQPLARFIMGWWFLREIRKIQNQPPIAGTIKNQLK